MCATKEEVVKAEEAFANQTADIASKLSDTEKELALTRHDLELKSKDADHLQKELDGAKKTLADRDAELEEALKNVAFLKQNESRLEKELAQAEHLHLHHKGESEAEAARADDIEKELAQLREDLVKANMALNHQTSGGSELQKLNNELKAEAKRLQEENKELHKQVTADEHTKAHMQTKIDNEAKHVENAEAGLAKAHDKIAELEKELKKIRQEAVATQDDLSARTLEREKGAM